MCDGTFQQGAPLWNQHSWGTGCLGNSCSPGAGTSETAACVMVSFFPASNWFLSLKQLTIILITKYLDIIGVFFRSDSKYWHFYFLPFGLEVHLGGCPKNNLVVLQSDCISASLFSGTDDDKILWILSFLITEEMKSEVATCWPLDDVRVQLAGHQMWGFSGVFSSSSSCRAFMSTVTFARIKRNT